VTGRVADASLTVGPALHEFGWQWDDWNKLASASVAGHVIECGAQATGGYSVDWQRYELDDVGYPIAELSMDGGTVITKPAGSGGADRPRRFQHRFRTCSRAAGSAANRPRVRDEHPKRI